MLADREGRFTPISIHSKRGETEERRISIRKKRGRQLRSTEPDKLSDSKTRPGGHSRRAVIGNNPGSISDLKCAFGFPDSFGNCCKPLSGRLDRPVAVQLGQPRANQFGENVAVGVGQLFQV